MRQSFVVLNILVCFFLSSAAKSDIDIARERALFLQDVSEFKKQVLGDNGEPTHQECQAYFSMLKAIPFATVEMQKPSIFRQVVWLHKNNLLAQEERLKQAAQHMLGQGVVKDPTDVDIRRRLDLLMQGVYFAFSPASMVSRMHGDHIGTVPLASVFSMTVASTRVLFTSYNVYNFAKSKKQLNKLKRKLQNIEDEQLRLSKIREKPPTGMPPELLAAYKIDLREAQKAISQMKPVVQQMDIGMKKAGEFVGWDVTLTSVYFFSSLPYLLGASGVAVGLATSIVGTIGYGAILGYLIGNLFAADLQKNAEINGKIERSKKEQQKPEEPAKVAKIDDPDVISVKEAARALRHDNLVHYQKSLSTLNLTRDVLLLSLASSIMLLGGLNVAIICGVTALAGVAVGTGYGLVAAAGVAFAMSVAVYAIERQWGPRFHDFLKEKVLGKKLKEEDFPAVFYNRMSEEYKSYRKCILKRTEAFDNILEKFSKELLALPPLGQIQESIRSIFASNVDLTETKLAMDRLGVKILPYRVVLQTATKEKAELAKKMFTQIEHMHVSSYKTLLEKMGIDPTILGAAFDLTPLELVRYLVGLWILYPL